MDLWQPARTLAAELTAAGVRATTDPADTHRPVALVAPTSVTPVGGGCAIVELQVSIQAAGGDVTQHAWLWSTALPAALTVVGLVDVTADTTPDGMPAVTLTVEKEVT